MVKRLASIFRLNRSGIGRVLGDLEKAIMEVLWEQNREVTGREVFEEIERKKPVAFTTVLTVIERLLKKGLVKRMKKGKLFVYTPTISRDEFIKKVSEEVIQGIVDISATSAASSFIDILSRTSPEDMERLAELINEKRGSYKKK